MWSDFVIFFFSKKNISIFKTSKSEIKFFFALYLIILISLILTNYKDVSFLPSFFILDIFFYHYQFSIF